MNVAKVLDALYRAQRFIRNGIEFGYIRMPEDDSPDSALQTPKYIDAAIAEVRTWTTGAGTASNLTIVSPRTGRQAEHCPACGCADDVTCEECAATERRQASVLKPEWISTYPSLPKDDPRRRAYYAGLSDAFYLANKPETLVKAIADFLQAHSFDFLGFPKPEPCQCDDCKKFRASLEAKPDTPPITKPCPCPECGSHYPAPHAPSCRIGEAYQ
ncbi:MAG: hypothetical protein KKB59_10410 [Spirochaetes bacterium]|nr:hypothetical protein [Spirochaetota bacterium]